MSKKHSYYPIVFAVILVTGVALAFISSKQVFAATPGCYANSGGTKSTALCDSTVSDTNGDALAPGTSCYIVAPEQLPAGDAGPAGNTYSDVSCTDLTTPVVASQAPTVQTTPSGNITTIKDDPTCIPTPFLGIIPAWYEYLHVDRIIINSNDSSYQSSSPNGTCQIRTQFTDSNHDLDLSAFLAVGLAILDGLLRVSAVVAVAFVLYGAFRYLTSQGEPENTKIALQSIINAFIGLVIVIIAAAVVSFIGAKLGG